MTESSNGESPSKKKAKTGTFEDVLNSNVRTEAREAQLQKDYLSSKPYKHARIENIFHVDFLTECKEQIKQNSKVNFKETDLFRVYQSVDFANLVPNSEDAQKMPAVMKLREVLYAQEWRSNMERLTQLPPGTLSDQVDCACNCHAPGCHLLCHDDVIGTRKISYILYLTEPDWAPEEGGALELYDSYVSGDGVASATALTDKDKVARREPESCPSKTLLPLFNSMAFFVVEPGVSFHAVQEVLGNRPRLSVQGWYHAASVPENVEHATLNRLKEQQPAITIGTPSSLSDHNNNAFAEQGGFTPLKDERVQPLEQQRKQRAANADKLLDSDRDYLALYVNETYLTKTSMEEIRERFEEDSSVQLRHFFRTSWNQQIKQAIEGHDNNDDAEDSRPKVGEKGYYEWGASDEWKIVGPPHKQRYLEYQAKNENNGSARKNASAAAASRDPLAQALPPQTTSAGLLMDRLKEKVMQSPAFGRYLNYVTSLGVPTGYKGQVRRFRPGLDYTVAHYGILTQTAVLDATICFAAGTGGVGAPSSSAESPEDTEPTSTKCEEADKAEMNESDQEDEDIDEADVYWQSDDVGGFECYIEADDFEHKDEDNDNEQQAEEDEEIDMKEDNGDSEEAATAQASSSEAADEYNAEDDTNLLSVSASNNTLSLVYRDPGTMRFIKYVGSRAPSSRWDISMVYQVPEDENDHDK